MNEALDNQVEEQKEPTAEERVEHFKNNMDEYIHLSELVVATKFNVKGGLQILVNPTSQVLLEQSLTRINLDVYDMLRSMKIKKLSDSGKLILPGSAEAMKAKRNGGIMNFVRGKK